MRSPGAWTLAPLIKRSLSVAWRQGGLGFRVLSAASGSIGFKEDFYTVMCSPKVDFEKIVEASFWVNVQRFCQ